MTYTEALTYIKQVENFGSKPGTARILKLLDALGNPQNNYKVIHIAGTNGKGSTTTMTANALIHAGYTVGKYMSPFVYDFGERITINNTMISAEELSNYVEIVKDITISNNLLEDHPTEFEIITAIALLYFSDKGCDYVCLEVGLGGRLDATNVIEHPLLCAITAISFDHTEYLGTTIAEIAKEKCGIVKNCPVVSYPLQSDEALTVIKEYSKDLIIPDVTKLQIIEQNLHGTTIIYREQSYQISLLGEHQIYNALTVIEICHTLIKLGVSLNTENISYALAHSFIHARMEVVSNAPLTILDGAHNIDGILALSKSLKIYFKNQKVCMIMGMLYDKDYAQAVEKISENVDFFIATPVNNPRCATADLLTPYSRCMHTYTTKNLTQAIALTNTLDFDILVICGSLYLAGESSQFFKKSL